jgi:hypothetical protein
MEHPTDLLKACFKRESCWVGLFDVVCFDLLISLNSCENIVMFCIQARMLLLFTRCLLLISSNWSSKHDSLT